MSGRMCNYPKLYACIYGEQDSVSTESQTLKYKQTTPTSITGTCVVVDCFSLLFALFVLMMVDVYMIQLRQWHNQKVTKCPSCSCVFLFADPRTSFSHAQIGRNIQNQIEMRIMVCSVFSKDVVAMPMSSPTATATDTST